MGASLINTIFVTALITDVDTKQTLLKKVPYEEHPEKCFRHAEYLNKYAPNGYLDSKGKHWQVEFKCMRIKDESK